MCQTWCTSYKLVPFVHYAGILGTAAAYYFDDTNMDSLEITVLRLWTVSNLIDEFQLIDRSGDRK